MKSLASALSILAVMTASTGAEPVQAVKPKILVHLTSGPENPTKAALAFLVARTAIEQGHSVSMVLAGDAGQLLRDATLDNLSGMSSNARGHPAANQPIGRLPTS